MAYLAVGVADKELKREVVIGDLESLRTWESEYCRGEIFEQVVICLLRHNPTSTYPKEHPTSRFICNGLVRLSSS